MNNLLEELEKLGGDPRNALNEIFLDDRKLYIDCLRKFPTDGNMQMLRKAIAEKNAESAIHAAHTLKGVADNLGLLPIVDAAYSVLSDLRTGHTELVATDMTELESVYSLFTAELGKA